MSFLLVKSNMLELFFVRGNGAKAEHSMPM